MATISDVRVNYGLAASAVLTGAGRTGTAVVGISNTQKRITADTGYAGEAVLLTNGDELVLSLDDGDTTGSTALTAGAAQVETATAAGTIGTSGNASVVVTAAGMTGSPKTIAVAVTNGDTAATWAGKVRTALAADSAVSALFTVSGTSTAIILTRKPTATYNVGGVDYPVYAANDATLNISLDNGTCTGITTASTSADTTAGVLTTGGVNSGFGVDVEGGAITPLAEINGVLIHNSGTAAVTVEGGGTDSLTVAPDSFALIAGESPITIDNELTITSAGYANLLIAVFGPTS